MLKLKLRLQAVAAVLFFQAGAMGLVSALLVMVEKAVAAVRHVSVEDFLLALLEAELDSLCQLV